MIKELFKKQNIEVINKIITITFYILIFPLFIVIPEKMNVGHYSLKTSYFSLICIIIAVLLLFFNIYRLFKQKIKIIEVFLLFYVFLILLSTLNSNYIKAALWGSPQGRGEGFFTLCCYLLCYYISSKIYNRSKLIETLTTISVIIISSVGIIQALLGRYYGFAFELIEDGEYMAYGTMLNPNFFSTFVTIFLPMYIISYLHNKDNYMLYVIGIIFGGLVCSKSLGGYVTFIIYTLASFIYFMIISKNKKKTVKQLLTLLLLFITIFALLNGANNNKYFEEIKIIKDDVENVAEKPEELGNNRGFIWNMCFEILEDNWLFGIGPDSLGREVVTNYMDKEDYIFGGIIIDKAHCEYLQIAVTTGIPSLIIYVCLLGTILIRILKKFIIYVKSKKLNSDNAIFLVTISASILAYIVQAFVNISVTCVAPMFWCILGIGYKISNKSLNEEA